MKKQRIIGTAIAFVALVMVLVLPMGELSLGSTTTTIGSQSTTVSNGSVALPSLLVLFSEIDDFSAMGQIGDGCEIITIVWMILLIFPVFGVVANLIGKVRVLAAWLMLIPFIWGFTTCGVAVWVYGALTIVLIVYSMYMKIKSKKAVAN